jgi:hypothetical protein
MQYYDIQRHWRRIRPHLADPKVAEVLVRDFNKFTFGRWGHEFLPGMVPHEFESCDWWCDLRGRMPAFWKYVKHAACHWLVNFNLELAQASVPDRVWRIVTSEEHSTVWDGDVTLFDPNLMALQVPPAKCFKMACNDGWELHPGRHLEVHYADHYSARHE